MKLGDALCGLLAISGIMFAIWQLMLYLNLANGMALESGTKHLMLAILSAVVAIGSVVAYLRRHPHVEEEIHVTK
ncbi:MAG: hypothetical protein ABIZ95_00935 [Pyrinomonadaceae bacterium]